MSNPRLSYLKYSHNFTPFYGLRKLPFLWSPKTPFYGVTKHQDYNKKNTIYIFMVISIISLYFILLLLFILLLSLILNIRFKVS